MLNVQGRILSQRSMGAWAGVLLAGAAGSANAQVFSNGSSDAVTPALALATLTGSGTPAPGASLWSEVASVSPLLGNALAGVACHADAGGGVRVADDFVVPTGTTWTVVGLRVYAYMPGTSGTESGLVSGTVRLWRGAPGSGVIVFGDTTANRLGTVTATDAYRVFTTTAGPALAPTDTSRRLFAVDLAVSASLDAGTYWVDVQLATASGAEVFVVPVTVAGVRSQAGWNARQWADGAWTDVIDIGKPAGTSPAPQDIAFVLLGSVGGSCDSIDFNRNGVYPEDQDVIDFFQVLAGGACPYAEPCDVDVNNNGVFPEDQDVVDFFAVLAGGTC